MEVKGRGQKALVEFTMHSKQEKKEFTMHSSKEEKKEEIMQTTEEEESKQTKEDEAEETKQEEKLIQTEASIIIVSDSDDSDTEAYDSDTEDILVPEVLMNLTTDS